ncbi:MAG: hypothetical protein Q8Q33_07175 [Chlamydiota bacterium]|nr:hypothetical protein [Chlamydiota bacterium]
MRKLLYSLMAMFLLSIIPAVGSDYVILDTLDDETVEPGFVVLQIGVWVEKQIDESTLIQGPRTLVRIPLGPWAELGLKTGFIHLSDSPTYSDESGFNDLEVTLKAVPFQIGDFNLGFAFITKVPTADDSKGLGTDEADFIPMAIAGYNMGDLHLFVNLGAAILGDPRTNSSQDDFFIWGIGAEYDLSNLSDSVICENLTAMLEIDGSAGPTDNLSVAEGMYTDKNAEVRFGFVKKISFVNVGITGSFGFTDNSSDWGVRAILSYNWETPWAFTQDGE